MNEKNPFKLMIQGCSNTQVLQCAASLTKIDIDSYACEMEDADISRIEDYTFRNCEVVGVQKACICGCLLELHASAVFEENDPSKAMAMYERLGIGRSSAYEYRAIWRRFGARIITEPALARQFVTESLRILSRSSVPDAVIELAIERARGGEMVTSRLALELRDTNSAFDESSEGAHESTGSPISVGKRTGNKPKGVWQFPGQAVRIILKPAVNAGFQNTAQVIQDLRDAIEQLIVDQVGTDAESSKGGAHASAS